MSNSNDDKDPELYSVQVVDTHGTALQELTLKELRGLDALVTPAWIYSTKTRGVCWANTEARSSYFGEGSRRSSLDTNGARTSLERNETNPRTSFESSSTRDENDAAAMKIHAHIENEDRVLHITCPRRMLFKDDDVEESNEIVKLIVRPIVIRQSSNGGGLTSDDVRVNSEHLMLFQELSLPQPSAMIGSSTSKTMDKSPSTAPGTLERSSDAKNKNSTFQVNATDTPLDIIMRMLDMIASGAQVPAVHARFVKAVCAQSEAYTGSGIQTRPFESLHQPLALSSIAEAQSNHAMKGVEPTQRSRLQHMFDSLNIWTSKNQSGGDANMDREKRNWKRVQGGLTSCFVGDRRMASAADEERPAIDARVLQRRVCKEALCAFNEPSGAQSESSIRKIEAVLEGDLSAFDAWTCYQNSGCKNMLAKITFVIIESTGLLEALRIPSDRLASFLMRIEAGYSMRRPYHNALHASCVVVSVYDILFKRRAVEKIGLSNDNYNNVRNNNIILFATIIAAAIHDYQHMGLSNKCIVDLQLPLAIIYNDICPQEQHHSASAFHLMTKHEFQFFQHWPIEEQRMFRNYVISLVLHTDMNKHFSILTKLRMQPTGAPLQDTMLLLQMVLKAADMSHLTYPPDLHRKWVMVLQEEMFCQGDFEKTRGIPPSAMCDRALPSISETQPDFFEYLALPMFTLFAEKEPTAFEWMLQAVHANYDMWKTSTR